MPFQFVSAGRKAISDAIDGMMRQMGETGLGYMREIVPVDTGHLKSSLGYVYRQSDKTLVLYADAPYAAIVELGSSRQAAQPYIRPALLRLRGFRLGAVNTEIGFQNSAGAIPAHDTSERNAKINEHLNRGVVRRTRVRVRQYSPARVTGDRD